MNPIMIIIAAIGGITGGLSTVYLTISLPAVILWKLYRRVAKGIPVTK